MARFLRSTISRNLPADPFLVAKQLRSLPGLVFLDSAAAGEGISILGALPREILRGSAADWPKLERAIEQLRAPDSLDLGVPQGAAIGSVDYDGSFYFGIYPNLAIFRHAVQSWELIGDPSWLDLRETAENLEAGFEPLEFVPLVERDDFVRSVQRAQEYIAAGDIYQVNLSYPNRAPFSGDPLALYERLRAASPAPHAAYLKQDFRMVLSSSPETFLSLDGRRIRTRPIKGTRPRFRDPIQDERSAYELMTSAKEIAELIMITDLERNDIGKIAEYGSVTVTELLKLERFAQVFHLVSTVEGRLKPDISHPAALRSSFPGGSITGAPKKRAMEIIAELESHPRGLYTGAIGYFGFNDESQFSIAIRTVTVEGGMASFHAGAGIVADSVPELEYEETLHKAAGIRLAAGAH